jgi:two-component system chemotaxis response regulator CheB
MPKGFTAPFAARINGISKIRVKEACDGEILEPSKALICPGGYHMLFKKRGKKIVASIKEPKPADKYIPSVDIMMLSMTDIYGPGTTGVILTGMGNDGKAGMLEIKKRGGYTIVESEETAVVFGMPGEVIKAGAAGRVLPISEIPAELMKLVQGSGQMED